MFIRQKIIYNNPYAYLVRTKWDKRSKKVKQKVSKYLGKIYHLERVKDTTFSDYYSCDIEKYIYDTPLKKMGKPTDIAKAAIFLASEKSNYITGHSLVVDGGWLSQWN